MADLQWVVGGNQYQIRSNQHVDEVPVVFTLDASSKHIDATHHETPAGTSGGKLRGVYKISGDSLTVCYDLTGNQYPTELEANRGSRRVLYQFRRE